MFPPIKKRELEARQSKRGRTYYGEPLKPQIEKGEQKVLGVSSGFKNAIVSAENSAQPSWFDQSSSPMVSSSY